MFGTKITKFHKDIMKDKKRKQTGRRFTLNIDTCQSVVFGVPQAA